MYMPVFLGDSPLTAGSPAPDTRQAELVHAARQQPELAVLLALLRRQHLVVADPTLLHL